MCFSLREAVPSQRSSFPVYIRLARNGQTNHSDDRWIDGIQVTDKGAYQSQPSLPDCNIRF